MKKLSNKLTHLHQILFRYMPFNYQIQKFLTLLVNLTNNLQTKKTTFNISHMLFFPQLTHLRISIYLHQVTHSNPPNSTCNQ